MTNPDIYKVPSDTEHFYSHFMSMMLTTVLCFEHYHRCHAQRRTGAQGVQVICPRSHNEWQTDSGTQPKPLIGNVMPFFFLLRVRKLNMTISRSGHVQRLTSSYCGIWCLLAGGPLHMASVESRIQQGHRRSSQPFIQIIHGVSSVFPHTPGSFGLVLNQPRYWWGIFPGTFPLFSPAMTQENIFF